MGYRPPVEDDRPWYRQFWPWMLIALPGTAVIGGLITIFLAVSDADGLVKDDYYKEGLAIKKDLDKEARARELGLEARVRLDASKGRLEVVLSGASEATGLPYLDVQFFHPTRKGNDVLARLPALGDGLFALPLVPPKEANWHVSLTPPEGDWVLKGRIRLPEQSEVLIQ
jgi:hypothetical protein